MTLMKLKLLELGEFQKCSELDNVVFDSSVFGDGDPSSEGNPYQLFDRYEALYNERVSSHVELPSDSLIRKMQREVIDSFNKESLACKRCDFCGSFSPALRKDGSSKIFEKPLQKRLRKSMSGMKLSLKVFFCPCSFLSSNCCNGLYKIYFLKLACHRGYQRLRVISRKSSRWR